jgi:hypothetical protein
MLYLFRLGITSHLDSAGREINDWSVGGFNNRIGCGEGGKIHSSGEPGV